MRFDPVMSATPASLAGIPPQRNPSRLERQTDILLRQRRLSMLGSAQIVELVESHPFLERRFVREAVQQHRQPPGYAGGRPHPAQRHVGIALEAMGLAAPARL